MTSVCMLHVHRTKNYLYIYYCSFYNDNVFVSVADTSMIYDVLVFCNMTKWVIKYKKIKNAACLTLRHE